MSIEQIYEVKKEAEPIKCGDLFINNVNGEPYILTMEEIGNDISKYRLVHLFSGHSYRSSWNVAKYRNLTVLDFENIGGGLNWSRISSTGFVTMFQNKLNVTLR